MFKYLVPITRGAYFNTQLLQAAIAETSGPTVTFSSNALANLRLRVALSEDIDHFHEQQIQQLCDDNPKLVPESKYTMDTFKASDAKLALETCQGLVLSSSPDDLEFMRQELTLVEAAKSVGVERIVKVSCPSDWLGERSIVEMGRGHWEIEEAIKATGISYEFVRPNTLMDAFCHGRWFEMVCGRTFSIPVKHGRVAFVHGMDVAEVCVKLMRKKSLENKEHNLTGPEALTFQQATKLISEGIGSVVHYSFFPLWAVQPSLWIKGVRPDEVAKQIHIAKCVENGAEQTVTPSVQDLLGKKPRTFDQFVKEHEHSWPLAAFK